MERRMIGTPRSFDAAACVVGMAGLGMATGFHFPSFAPKISRRRLSQVILTCPGHVGLETSHDPPGTASLRLEHATAIVIANQAICRKGPP